ncbi:uncharacterized protein BP5553_09611 [Venustampulla echinocandica]|uniref:Uncharacterized protein n=1 Tax=Venustampulla echinocandica TaxID=2656787 RepID=A0A370TBH7_9HELO|nr:uncharacterized protein BP5553_09611 [Venustampulla echinocandica]RDL31402.1 hypothetical protein BP5553_09611 [Venustampulla echinocandica]
MADGTPVPGSLYVYAPNRIASIFFTVAFAASAVGHIWQCYRYKCFKLIGLHPFCAVLFTAGYALREYGAFNYLYTSQNLIIYIFSQVFIFMCPPLLELANYHVLGRIFYYVPYSAPLPPGRVLSTFGALMALVETLNALGVALTSNRSSSHQELGRNLIIAALAIQLGVIVIFIVLAAIFHKRCTKANIHAKAVSTPLITLYIIRLDDLEALMTLSPILRYEWFFYVFEATLMLINSVLWNVWNPGRYLPKSYHVYLAQDGRTELQGQDEADDRPLLAKAGSVLTFGFLFRNKKVNRQFEELNEYQVANRQA